MGDERIPVFSKQIFYSKHIDDENKFEFRDEFLIPYLRND
jgi:hypothetical protein